MLHLQQPEMDALTISATNTQIAQKAKAVEPRIISAGAEYPTSSPDITWISPTQPPSFKSVPLPKEEKLWRHEQKSREICTEEVPYVN